MGGLEEADKCLVKMGYTTGVRGAIRRFREHTAALQELALHWHPDPPEPANPASESAEHPNGIFKIEADGPDKGRLMHVWPGWGRRFLAAGRPEDLRSQALRVVRQGGPFGGPTIARKGEHVVQVREPQGGMRHPLADGSEIRTLVLGDRMLGVRVWPDGRFAHLPITDSLDALARLIEDDAEHISIGSKRKPWIFTNVHPFVGMIRSGSSELLLCALRVDLVGLFISRGDELVAVKIGPWAKIREQVRDEDFASPSPSGAGKSATAPKAPAGEKSDEGPGTGEKSAPGAGAKEAPASENSAEPSTTTDKDAPSRRRKRVRSPGAALGRRERRVRLKAPLAFPPQFVQGRLETLDALAGVDERPVGVGIVVAGQVPDGTQGGGHPFAADDGLQLALGVARPAHEEAVGLLGVQHHGVWRLVHQPARLDGGLGVRHHRVRPLAQPPSGLHPLQLAQALGVFD